MVLSAGTCSFPITEEQKQRAFSVLWGFGVWDMHVLGDHIEWVGPGSEWGGGLDPCVLTLISTHSSSPLYRILHMLVPLRSPALLSPSLWVLPGHQGNSRDHDQPPSPPPKDHTVQGYEKQLAEPSSLAVEGKLIQLESAVVFTSCTSLVRGLASLLQDNVCKSSGPG